MEISARPTRREEKLKERLRVVKMINISYLVALFLLGVIMLGIAAWMINAKFWQCPILNVVYVCPWVFLSLGVLSLFLSVIGIIIFLQGRSHGTFMPFMVATGVLVVGLLIVLILSAKIGGDLETHEYATSLFDLFIEAKTEFFANDFAHRPLLCWESFQRNLKCCGGNAPADWIDSSNQTDSFENSSSHSIVWLLSAPRSCDCSEQQPNGTCIYTQSSEGVVRRIFKSGCISSILTIARDHLIILKVLTPCIAMFIVCHLSLSLCLTLRVSRMSTVDVYSMGDGQSASDSGNVREVSLRRTRRFADVNGVAPLALQLETTMGCT